MSKMIHQKDQNLITEYEGYLSASNHQLQISVKDVFDMDSRFWTTDHTYALDQVPVAEIGKVTVHVLCFITMVSYHNVAAVACSVRYFAHVQSTFT